MSSQKGNIAKKGPPKHNNKWAYNNSMHDVTKKTKEINKLEILGACEKCTALIEWKIRYKKYKQLTGVAKCVRCNQKNVKRAYYLVCEDCGIREGVCGKCGKPEEIVNPYIKSQVEIEIIKELDEKLQFLPEGFKRTMRRRIEKDEDLNEILKDVNKKNIEMKKKKGIINESDEEESDSCGLKEEDANED